MMKKISAVHCTAAALAPAFALLFASLPGLSNAHDKHDAADKRTASTNVSKKGYHYLPLKANGSGVRIAYKLESVPQVGKPLTISLQMDRVTHEQGASLEWNADKELNMDAATTATAAGNNKMSLTSKSVNTQRITVTPQQEGVYFINVFTEQAGRKSASAIAIRVGNKPIVLPTIGEVKTEANGEKVISIPSK